MKPEKNIPFWLLEKHCRQNGKLWKEQFPSVKCGYFNFRKKCCENNCPLIHSDKNNYEYVEIAKKLIETGESKLINMTPI